ncbi:MAG: hypothetical protein JNG85_04525 [Spirochaetaceae bacterium]|nr:hypothetical protein [Spirochaetaceae bacterium]
MDSRIVNQKALEYTDRIVRLTPVVIQQLGLEKRTAHLKIEEFYISCIPFDLSLKKASLLAFLSEPEVKLFSGMAKKPQKLSLTFNLPYASKPATFFILADILAFRKPAAPSPYCFIDVSFREAPLVLKEILVAHFMENDEAERFWKETPDEALSPEGILAVLDSSRLTPLKEGSSMERLKVCALSPRHARLFGEFESPPPGKGDILDFEPSEGDSACIVRGTCLDFRPFAEAPGFAFLELELQFGARLHMKMKRHLAGKRQKGEEKEEGRGEQ